MGGLRGFLVGIANFILFLLVVVAPLVAFAAGGVIGGQWVGGFSKAAAFGAALITFIAALPAAALLATFLDIRQQLVFINQNTRSAPALVTAEEGRVSALATVSADTVISSGQVSPVEEMQIWFRKQHGFDLSPSQGMELLTAKNEGRFLTVASELKARLK